MSRPIDVSADDSRLLREILEVVGLDQKSLSARAGVSRPWLSGLLKEDRTKAVDVEMIERVAAILVTDLNSRPEDRSFSEDRVRIALTSLSRFTAAAAAFLPPRSHRPGKPIPAGTSPYIERQDDKEALQALKQDKDMLFTMLVRGSAQCGKSSLLARLEADARGLGIETASFDPRLSVSQTGDESSKRRALNAETAIALSELLQVQWGLDPDLNGQTDSIQKLLHWLITVLTPTASKPRLLILDDLSSLGPNSAGDWLSFVRGVESKLRDRKIHLSIAVGLTHQLGSYFRSKLLIISSLLHASPSIELDWFNHPQVIKLEEEVRGKSLLAGEVFEAFAGQPYLSHAALADQSFLSAVRCWTSAKTAEAQASADQALRETEPYARHLTAVRRAILGRAVELDGEASKLLQTFVDACSGREVIWKPAHREFLRQANLLDFGTSDRQPMNKSEEEVKPKIEIYRLIAKDLSKLLTG